MKLIKLPRGKQKGIKGAAVNVPADLGPACDFEYRATFENGLLTVIPPYGVTDGDSNDPDAFYLGFIPKCHYMSLHKIESTGNISTEESEEEVSINHGITTGEELEDEKAFVEACELRGLPYDTCLENETEEANQIFSLAPGEGNKPIHLLSDDLFEELSNPEKFPMGKGGFSDM